MHQGIVLLEVARTRLRLVVPLLIKPDYAESVAGELHDGAARAGDMAFHDAVVGVENRRPRLITQSRCAFGGSDSSYGCNNYQASSDYCGTDADRHDGNG